MNMNQLNQTNSPRWGAMILAIAITFSIFGVVGAAFDSASQPAARASAQAASAARNVAVAAAQPAP